MSAPQASRYILLEKVTALAQHREGGPPCWRLTNPQEQHGIGVNVWRSINGAWMDAFWQRSGDVTFAAFRVRMVDRDHLWRGFPLYVELYDIIGDTGREKLNYDVEDMSELLLDAIKRAETKP